MEIITRQEAITRGLYKYFTGEPCRNGHLAARYTQSSTCEDCLRATRGTVVDGAERLQLLRDKLTLEQQKLEFRMNLRHERNITARRRDAIGRMMKTRVLARAADIDLIYDAAHAFARLHNPIIERRDVVLAFAPRNSTWGLRCFPADLEAIQQFANSIWKERGGDPEPADAFQKIEIGKSIWPELALVPLDVSEARRRALESAEREAAEQEEPPPFVP